MYNKLNLKDNLYLIGPMGAGKSSIGLKLAELLQRPFFDSDREIEKRCGVSISWIFEKEQERGFRRREAAIIHELCQQTGLVLSTGGGAILNEQTRSILKKTGMIIYLKVSLEEQVQRTGFRKKSRPLLERDPEKTLSQLNQERESLYKAMADICILTDQQSSTEIAHNIWKIVQSANNQAN